MLSALAVGVVGADGDAQALVGLDEDEFDFAARVGAGDLDFGGVRECATWSRPVQPAMTSSLIW